MGDREDLGEHGDLGRQAQRHWKDRGIGPNVEILSPAPEQMWRFGAGERIAVVLKISAEVVGEIAQTELAVPSCTIGSRDHSLAYRKRVPVEIRSTTRTDLNDLANVLVTLNDRKRCGAGVVGARVLRRLATKCVLVGAANA